MAATVTTKPKAPVGAAILGAIFGLLSGIGFGLFFQVAGVMSPLSKTTLLVPAAGLILGLLAGIFGGRRTRAAVVAAPAVAEPAPPSEPAPPPAR
jgi:hypothetical protein